MNTNVTRRLAAVALSAGVGLSLSAVPAFAAPNPAPAEGAVTASNIAGNDSYGPGWNDVINGRAAASRFVIVEGADKVQVFCVQEGIAFNDSLDAKFSALTWEASAIGNPAKAAGIAVNAPSIGTPLEDPRSEGSAVQLAVWKMSNNLDYGVVNNAAIKARADELVANAPDAVQGSSSYTLKASNQVTGDNNVISVTFAGNTGPVANTDVSMKLAGADAVAKTNAEGVATFTVPVRDAAASASFSAGTILAKGSILAPGEGQLVVTTQDASITRTAAVDLPAVVAPPVDPEPPVVVEPPVDPEPPVVVDPPVEPPVVVEPPVEPPVAEEPPVVNPEPEAPAAEVPVANAERPAKLPHTGTWMTPTIIGLSGAAVAGGFFLRRYLLSRA